MRNCLIIIIIFILYSCNINKRISYIHSNKITPSVVLNEMPQDSLNDDLNIVYNYKDSLDDSIIMNAVIDQEDGEMVATDNLESVFVRASFRNVAERNGYVDLGFELNVPNGLINKDWQLRFQPLFYIGNDTLFSDKVLITGANFRLKQDRGYESFNKFLDGIIPDSSDYISNFCYEKLMLNFIKRRSTNDSLWLQKAIENNSIEKYYTKNWKYKLNERRKNRIEQMFRKFVKTPLISQGVRLDSIIYNNDGSLSYYYVQSLNIINGIKKVDMVLQGDIINFDKQLYVFPETQPLTYYISSLSNLVENKVMYLYEVIERNLIVNTVAYIDFLQGSYKIIDTLHNNLDEINRIESNIYDIINDPKLALDSLIITAACSPEGTFSSNNMLARNRANSVKEYLLMKFNDSLTINTKWIAEDWARLNRLIYSDTNLANRDYILECFEIEDFDEREKWLKRGVDYVYLRGTLYPYLRCVKLEFNIHRKGMLKDTIHSKIVDSLYAKGLMLLKNADYQASLGILKDYKDFNTALAYLSLDYNYSAKEIIENFPESAKKFYLLAIIYSRLEQFSKAIHSFNLACEKDPSMRFRGNLDPEIKKLIDKYKLKFN